MPVREDLADAHRLAWEHIAAPGTWWTGPQRVELAQTALFAIADPDPSPPWISITSTGKLPEPQLAPRTAHDVMYRISRHAGTMTESVYRAAVDELGELPYVELCAISSTVAAVARFCRNIGVDVPRLPAPIEGEPTRQRPEHLAPARYNWVPVAAPADEVAAVVQAYTAVPAEQANTWRMAAAQYMPADEMLDPDWRRRPTGLSRAQMELVAARLTKLRDCFY
ncbi:MAG TPA: hypothetical protein VMK16_03195 [Acidimicrobiales bacterium]|nr:hypothetical protein [Acidimicrobiales bacterium]